MNHRHLSWLLLAGAVVLVGCDHAEHLDFVVENGDTVVGSLAARLEPASNDSTLQELQFETRVSLRALGKDVDLHREERLEIDPRTGLAVSIVRTTRMNGLELTGILTTDADSVRLIGVQGQRLNVARAADLMLEDGLHYRFLLRGLDAALPDTVWHYRGIDLDGGRVVDVVAHREPTAELDTPAGVVRAQVVRLYYPGRDAVRRLWIDPADQLLLQSLGDGMRLRRGSIAPITPPAPASGIPSPSR